LWLELFENQFLYKNPKSIPDVQFNIDYLQLPVLSKTPCFLTFENLEIFIYFSFELLLELSINKFILFIFGILSSEILNLTVIFELFLPEKQLFRNSCVCTLIYFF
jgi:hypothetical protein